MLTEPTREQELAIDYVSGHYGAAGVTATPDGYLRVEGLDDDSKAQCRWIVREDGTVREAWDPEVMADGRYLLDHYQEYLASQVGPTEGVGWPE